MKRIVVWLQALVMVLTVGCWEAEPDQDTMGDLRDSITNIPPEIQGTLAKWAANRIAYGYTLNARGDNVGHLFCANTQNQTGEYIAVEMERLLVCLIRNPTLTYFDCLPMLVSQVEDEHTAKGYRCDWSSFSRGMDPKEVPPEFRADKVTLDDVTKALLGPPPPLEIQLLLMGLSGVMGPAGFLCVQGADWACAPDPFAGEPSTSASSGGGDR